MLRQRTVAKAVSVCGIGIHSGRKVTLSIHPSESNSGIVFQRTDIPNAAPLRAHATNVGATENNTTLGEGVNCVHTVEHLLAVFYGLGIENALCQVDGPEVPIMDGSGASFIFLLKEAGVTHLNLSKKFLVVLKPVKVEVGEKWASLAPSKTLKINSTIVFPHSMIKTQELSFEFSCEKFINDIGKARTFALLRDVDQLKRRGLIKGGSLNNAVVLDDFKVVNKEGLRYRDEFVRHKILDTIGDLALLGHEIAGEVTTYMSGHNLHNLLCRKLLETPGAYEIVSASSLQEASLKAFDLPQGLSAAQI